MFATPIRIVVVGPGLTVRKPKSDFSKVSKLSLHVFDVGQAWTWSPLPLVLAVWPRLRGTPGLLRFNRTADALTAQQTSCFCIIFKAASVPLPGRQGWKSRNQALFEKWRGTIFKMEKLVRNIAAGNRSRNAGYNILLYSVYSFTCTHKDSKIHLKVGHRVFFVLLACTQELSKDLKSQTFWPGATGCNSKVTML